MRSDVTPVDSKVKATYFYHSVFALFQCSQIIDGHKFFLLTTREPQSNVDYNLGQNRMEQQAPPRSKINQDETAQKPKRTILSIIDFFFLGGGGGGGVDGGL